MTAGIAAVLAPNPVDVVKTRVMNMKVRGEVKARPSKLQQNISPCAIRMKIDLSTTSEKVT